MCVCVCVCLRVSVCESDGLRANEVEGVDLLFPHIHV